MQALNGPMMIVAGQEPMLDEMIASIQKIDRTSARFDDDVMRDLRFEEWSSYNEYGDFYSKYPVLVGSVLIIPVTGVLVRNDTWRSPGTNTLTAWYNVAAQDDRIERIIEYMDSPGGSVFGIEELVNAKIACPKPIETIVFGFCTSAAAWVASGSDSIKATSKSCLFGSIGTKTVYRNYSKYDAQQGIIVKDVYSADSPKKDNAYREADKGNFKPMENGWLKDIDNNFMAFVKSRRSVSDEVLQGDVYITEKAIAEKLCDGYTTLTQTINLNNLEMSGMSKMLRDIAAKLDGTGTDAELTTSIENVTAENEQLKATAAAAEAEKATALAAQAASAKKASDLEAAHAAEKAALEAAHAQKIADMEAKLRNQDAPAQKPSTPVATTAETLTEQEQPETPEKRIEKDPLTTMALAALEKM